MQCGQLTITFNSASETGVEVVSGLLRQDVDGRRENILVEESGRDLGKFSLLGSLTRFREGQYIGKILYLRTVLRM